MTISGGSALPKDEIDRMVKEAEAHAAEDKQRREEAETRNSAEQLVYTTEKVLTDNDEKLPDDVKTEVRAALAELKTALEGDDLAAVSAKQTALAAVSQKIGEALYAADQAAPADGEPVADAAPEAPQAEDDDVVDAEIVDEGDQK